jgi:hypothetical protein
MSETVYQVAVILGIWDPHSLKLLGKCNFGSEWFYIAYTFCEFQITLLIFPRMTNHAENMCVISSMDLTVIYTAYTFDFV